MKIQQSKILCIAKVIHEVFVSWLWVRVFDRDLIKGTHLEQFLDLLLDQKLLGRRMLVLLVMDGSNSRFGVNLMHLT